MEYAVNSITSVNTMYLGVVNRFAYISTVVTKDMKRVVTGPLVKTDSQPVAMLTKKASWLAVYR